MEKLSISIRESVKDRAALFIVEDAIKRKLISKGGPLLKEQPEYWYRVSSSL